MTKNVRHMNKRVSLFPLHELAHFHVSGTGEVMLNWFYAAVRKRKRAEFFRRRQRAIKGVDNVHAQPHSHN